MKPPKFLPGCDFSAQPKSPVATSLPAMQRPPGNTTSLSCQLAHLQPAEEAIDSGQRSYEELRHLYNEGCLSGVKAVEVCAVSPVVEKPEQALRPKATDGEPLKGPNMGAPKEEEEKQSEGSPAGWHQRLRGMGAEALAPQSDLAQQPGAPSVASVVSTLALALRAGQTSGQMDAMDAHKVSSALMSLSECLLDKYTRQTRGTAAWPASPWVGQVAPPLFPGVQGADMAALQQQLLQSKHEVHGLHTKVVRMAAKELSLEDKVRALRKQLGEAELAVQRTKEEVGAEKAKAALASAEKEAAAQSLAAAEGESARLQQLVRDLNDTVGGLRDARAAAGAEAAAEAALLREQARAAEGTIGELEAKVREMSVTASLYMSMLKDAEAAAREARAECELAKQRLSALEGARQLAGDEALAAERAKVAAAEAAAEQLQAKLDSTEEMYRHVFEEFLEQKGEKERAEEQLRRALVREEEAASKLQVVEDATCSARAQNDAARQALGWSEKEAASSAPPQRTLADRAAELGKGPDLGSGTAGLRQREEAHALFAELRRALCTVKLIDESLRSGREVSTGPGLLHGSGLAGPPPLVGQAHSTLPVLVQHGDLAAAGGVRQRDCDPDLCAELSSWNGLKEQKERLVALAEKLDIDGTVRVSIPKDGCDSSPSGSVASELCVANDACVIGKGTKDVAPAKGPISTKPKLQPVEASAAQPAGVRVGNGVGENTQAPVVGDSEGSSVISGSCAPLHMQQCGKGTPLEVPFPATSSCCVKDGAKMEERAAAAILSVGGAPPLPACGSWVFQPWAASKAICTDADGGGLVPRQVAVLPAGVEGAVSGVPGECPRQSFRYISSTSSEASGGDAGGELEEDLEPLRKWEKV